MKLQRTQAVQKKRMSHGGRKDKGRRLQKMVATMISDLIGLECGKDCPVESRQMGEAGPDVRLDSAARVLFPFTVECKNTEKWNLPAAIEQVRANQYKNTDWLVVLGKNRTTPVAVVELDVFFEILKGKPK